MAFLPPSVYFRGTRGFARLPPNKLSKNTLVIQRIPLKRLPSHCPPSCLKAGSIGYQQYGNKVNFGLQRTNQKRGAPLVGKCSLPRAAVALSVAKAGASPALAACFRRAVCVVFRVPVTNEALRSLWENRSWPSCRSTRGVQVNGAV